MALATYVKGPTAKQSYTVNFTNYLEGAETLVLASASTSGDTLIVSGTTIIESGKVVLFWADQGVVPTAYRVVIDIETSTGRKDRQSIIIECQNT